MLIQNREYEYEASQTSTPTVLYPKDKYIESEFTGDYIIRGNGTVEHCVDHNAYRCNVWQVTTLTPKEVDATIANTNLNMTCTACYFVFGGVILLIILVALSDWLKGR